MISKVCPRCKQPRPADAFIAKRFGVHVRFPRCVECRNHSKTSERDRNRAFSQMMLRWRSACA